MRTFIRAVAVVTLLAGAGAAAHAACISKAGRGTGGNDDSAKFQAWEAVLQGTDWGAVGQLDGNEPEGRRSARLQGEQRQGSLRCRRGSRQRVHGAREAVQLTGRSGDRLIPEA